MARTTSPDTDRRTLREHAVALVRQKVIGGELAPGAHIVESRLSHELDMSRGTVREALRSLESEGLVVGDGRGHLYVRELSSREIVEVFEVRTMLETLAVTKLTARQDRALLAEDLRAYLEPLKDEDLPFDRQIEIDLGFHARMCRMTGNATLVDSWERLIGRLEMVIIAAGPQKASDRMRYDEHDDIIRAIETGDTELALRVFREHMDSFCSKYARDSLERELGDR